MINNCIQLPGGLIVPETFSFRDPDGVEYHARLFRSGPEESAEDFVSTILQAGSPTGYHRRWTPAGRIALNAFNEAYPYVRDEVDVPAVGETFGGGDKIYRMFALLNGSSKPQPRMRWWLTKPLSRFCFALGVIRDPNNVHD